jgi:hypothetical protein
MMVDTIEFFPVEVIKEFMSLTVGDVLVMSPKTGNYELRKEAEDIGDDAYRYDKYEISLEPWIIQKYNDCFQIYDPIEEKSKEVLTEISHPVATESPETTVTYTGDEEINTCSPCGSDGLTIEEHSLEVDINNLRQELAELKEMFAKVQEMIEE